MPTYPYTSTQGALVQTFTQLRKGAPAKIDASYLKRFNIAPSNESYVLSILRFLRIIDEDGSRPEGTGDYLFGNDDEFKAGLEDTMRNAYSQLFTEMNDALQADQDTLIHWFRGADKTSELVGKRQASTFLTLAALSGHGELPSARTSNQKTVTNTGTSARKPKSPAAKHVTKAEGSLPDSAAPHPAVPVGAGSSSREVGLSVRVEVNLPADGDAATYDAIFASIKKHLMS
ncbi:AF1681 [Propionibacterium ruminifibrarum]|uniref:AF1681 n=1 Tax=Propionibacterium ruminifibrarum TaxID=1962131 RepID=A0A375I7M9_9ACTN|nr:DUF5343 domain-containing protein [Propionibacterium ruminifibrarum]SPF69540.1 AF1681 [Propionibacterium ruminifibrarum]